MLHGALSQPPQLQAEALKATKQTVVRSIDATLPAITLERWLQQQLGPRVEIVWEVNDCGEATGPSADQARDLPFCVDDAYEEFRQGEQYVVFEDVKPSIKDNPVLKPESVGTVGKVPSR